jgi:hypothetical protein
VDGRADPWHPSPSLGALARPARAPFRTQPLPGRPGPADVSRAGPAAASRARHGSTSISRPGPARECGASGTRHLARTIKRTPGPFRPKAPGPSRPCLDGRLPPCMLQAHAQAHGQALLEPQACAAACAAACALCTRRRWMLGHPCGRTCSSHHERRLPEHTSFLITPCEHTSMLHHAHSASPVHAHSTSPAAHLQPAVMSFCSLQPLHLCHLQLCHHGHQLYHPLQLCHPLPAHDHDRLLAPRLVTGAGPRGGVCGPYRGRRPRRAAPAAPPAPPTRPRAPAVEHWASSALPACRHREAGLLPSQPTRQGLVCARAGRAWSVSAGHRPRTPHPLHPRTPARRLATAHVPA